jgi:hypothetical protein
MWMELFPRSGPHTGGSGRLYNVRREGICVGKAGERNCWAITPDGSNAILQLVFEKEFGLLIDLSGDPDKN